MPTVESATVENAARPLSERLRLVDERLVKAFAPVLRDLDVAGLVRPGFRDVDWLSDPEVWAVSLTSPSGRVEGVRVEKALSEPEMVAALADVVQEWVIGEIWRTAPTNWPPCPYHPHTHPLLAVTAGDTAYWQCPVNQTLVALIGSL